MVRREMDVKVRRGKGDKKTQKKEALATAVYTIEPYLRTPEEVIEALFKKEEPATERPAPCHKQIFASLKGKEQAIKRLAVWAQRREGQHICQRVALTDGAEPLQKQMLACLPDFRWCWISFMLWNTSGRRARRFMGKPTRIVRNGWRRKHSNSCSAIPSKSSNGWKTRPTPCSQRSGRQVIARRRQLLSTQSTLYGLCGILASRLADRDGRD